MDRLADIDHVAFDLDGTLYRGDTLFEPTTRVLAGLAAIGVDYSLVTNNSSKSRAEYVARLEALGIDVASDRIVTSTDTTIAWLRREHPKVNRVFVLGTAGLCEDLVSSGFQIVANGTAPEAVVVGFDTSLEYQRLCAAARWIADGCLFVATNPDRVCPTDEPTVLVDCGALCACLESATGRAPDVVLGKPHPGVLDEIDRRFGVMHQRLAIVGDRLYTDIELARACGAMSVLVLSGETTAEAAAQIDTVDLVVPDVGAFFDRLTAARRRTGKVPALTGHSTNHHESAILVLSVSLAHMFGELLLGEPPHLLPRQHRQRPGRVPRRWIRLRGVLSRRRDTRGSLGHARRDPVRDLDR